jgi:hypothetical protein
LTGRRTCVFGPLADTNDVGGDLLRAGCSLLHVTGDLLGRRTLLFHCRGNGGGDLADLADLLSDTPDGINRFFGCGLDLRDLAGDVFGRLRGLGR